VKVNGEGALGVVTTDTAADCEATMEDLDNDAISGAIGVPIAGSAGE
jgi:hypothetical protein